MEILLENTFNGDVVQSHISAWSVYKFGYNLYNKDT